MVDQNADNLGTVLQGQGVSDGIVLGHVTRWDRHEIYVEHVRLPESLVAAELTRFRAAVDRAEHELSELYEQLSESGLAEGETLGLLDAHKMMLRDPAIIGDTERYIRDERLNAEWALSMTLKRYEAVFAAMKDPFFRERGEDVAQIGERLYRFLVEPDGGAAGAAMAFPRGTILVAHTLSPAEALAASRNVAAFVLETGTPTGHTAIIARSMQVPTVIGLPGVCDLVGDGDRIIVDGLEGEVVLRPSQYEEILYNRRAQRAKAVRKTVRQNRALPAVTPDGTRIVLRGNLDFASQAPAVEQHGGLGVGLFRTEFLFLERATPPNEDEQTAVYAELLRAMRPHPVTIRTLDIGGDKAFEFLGGPRALPTELRAIRYSLAHEEVFLTQLRALLRASGHGELRLLLPFVTVAAEIRRTKQLLVRASAELSERGVRHDPDISIGAMIELPAAALTADLIAREVDFLSVGTNDLMHYTMAVPRDATVPEYLTNPLQPAFLKLLQMITRAGRAAGVVTSICGELAGRPRFVPLLIALGFNELSMAPDAIPLVKEVVRRTPKSEALALFQRLQGIPEPEEAKDYLDSYMVEHFPDIVSPRFRGAPHYMR